MFAWFVLAARQNAKKKTQEKVEEAAEEEDSEEASSSSETEDSEAEETEEAEEETGALPIICNEKSPAKRLVRVFHFWQQVVALSH